MATIIDPATAQSAIQEYQQRNAATDVHDLLTDKLTEIRIEPSVKRRKAISLIREYRQLNASEGGPRLLTPDNQFLNGYFIDRQSLESALSNPKVVGVSLHLAKHPDFAGLPGNHFTIVFAGVEPNIAPGATTPYKNTGDIYDQLFPCPPWCDYL
jgi:hypothetical protein